jgi:hypothetical protein|tara:strand:- start:2146 stop:3450 length:1305 start_codon:yes stop_codon:yes gene_type:complete
MAFTALKGVKTKRKQPRAAARIKRGAKLTEPSWEGWEEMTGEQFHRAKDAARAWYYENFKPQDLYPSVWEWMKEQDYSKEEIKNAKSAPAYVLSITAAIVAKMLLRGMPAYNEKHAQYWESLAGTMGELAPSTQFLKKKIDDAIKEGSNVVKEKKEEEKEKKKVYVPSIQERISEQSKKAAEKIDDWLDGHYKDDVKFNPKGFDVKKHFNEYKVTQAHARKIKDFYQDELAEYRDVLNIPTAGQLKKMDEKEADLWEQLREGYSFATKPYIKEIISALEIVMDACDFVIEQSKVNRKARKPKPKSADKLVAKLKYKKQDDKFNILSFNATDIVGANEVWVFNCKTRKLGKYIAKNIDPLGAGREGTGLSVKGTTITQYNEAESVQKTLRKPEEQLKDFKNAGKVKLRTFLEEIKTTDTKLNGRINPDTVLLRVN